jgi:acyl-CoA synthetase (NDP forming)
MVPERGLNATLAENMALPGNIALISQSGRCALPSWIGA